MRRIIVILAFILIGITLFSSCKTRQRCAAYGYYSYTETVAPEQSQL
ncbi:hypothetical protein LJC53_03330 [Bacteroidales bacterium OttesenSCG-928-C03]|nr:hypothetical protein [Bacteroidales bacterium OttesenSCG-928-C03]